MSVSERAMHEHIATKKRLSFLDRIVIIASFLYPLSASSQVYEVFTGHADGVSPISWSIFLLCASLFLVYGVKHKITPMIIANSIWLVMDSLVIIGLLAQA